MSPNEKRLEVVKRLHEATKLEPFTEIVLRGNVYKLEYDNRQVKGILADTDVNVLEGFDGKKLNDPEFRTKLLYWGLKIHHPGLTEDQVDGLQPIRQAIYVTSKLSEALRAWFPDLTDDQGQLDLEVVQEPIPLPQKLNGFATGPLVEVSES